MLKATKILTFDAGHRLFYHQGKCKNLHGHTYKIEVTISAGILPEPEGMIMDFGELKSIMQQVIEPFDHTMILNEKDVDVINFCHQHNFKVYVMKFDPTAENLVLLFTNVT